MRKVLMAVAFATAMLVGGVAHAGNVGNGCIGNCPTTNNITNNTTNKGGTGIGVGIAKSSANASVRVKNTNVNVNKNTNVNVNKNTNVNVNKNANKNTNKNTNEQNQQANNNGNSQTIEAAASSAMAPSINPSATCQVPVTLGGMAIVGGGSLGTTYTSEDCVQREDTRLYCELANRDLSDKGMCRALADDLPTVRAYRERQRQAAAEKTSGVAFASSSSLPVGPGGAE